ncbi:MAG: hypothetical protein PHW38_02030 [Candidatus Cloacimonetes bacterium]
MPYGLEVFTVIIHKILELVRSLPIALLLNKKWEILSDLDIKCPLSIETKLITVILI